MASTREKNPVEPDDALVSWVAFPHRPGAAMKKTGKGDPLSPRKNGLGPLDLEARLGSRLEIKADGEDAGNALVEMMFFSEPLISHR